MKKKLMLLLLVSAMISAGAEKIFELNGKNGMNAVVRGEIQEPLKVHKVEIVPGIGGNALFIPSDGFLSFDVNKLGELKQGTVTFWLKLDTPMAATLDFMDRDRLPDGSIGNIGDAYRDIVSAGGAFAPIRVSHSHIYAHGIGGGVAYYKRMFPGKWHFFAYTWDAENQNTGSVIDFSYEGKENKKLSPNPFNGKLVFGDPRKGLNGAIADFTVYNQALSPEELRELYARHRPLDAELHDYALNAGKENTLRLRFKNFSAIKQEKKIGIDFLNAHGEKVGTDTVTATAGPGETVDVKIGFKPEKPGLYQMALDTGRVFEILAIGEQKIGERMKTGELNLKLVEEIDCAKEYGKDKFLSDGTTGVVASNAGKYREASNAFRSAFTYRLNKLKYPKRYYVLELEYPDDARRTFSVTLFSEGFGLVKGGQMNGTGILTGGEHPVTGKMQTRRLLWVPYSENVALICENYNPKVSDKGGALAKIRIYETQDDLLPKQYETQGNRSLGVWDEDMSMNGMWFNMNNLETNITLEFWREKAERMVEYANYMGYTDWTYQFHDYDGDRNGSYITMAPGFVPGSNGHIFGWCDVFAKIFERENIKFFGRLGYIFRNSKSAGGFIGEKNLSKDFDEYCSRGVRAVERISKDNEFIVRKSSRKRLNPLHPLFLENAKRVAAFYRDKYVANPLFQGVTFRESNVIFSLVSLDFGYEDWTVAQFGKETGVKVPVDNNSRTRFSERYKFLTSPEIKDQWVRWRCDKFAEICRETVEELRKGNNRLRMQLWMNCQTSMANSIQEDFSVKKTLLESGYDMELLATIDGLEIVPIIRPDFGHVRPDLTQTVQESRVMYSQSFAEAFAPRRFRNINMHLHNNLEQYRFSDTKLKEFFWKFGQWSWNNKNFHYGTWANSYPNMIFALLPLTNLLANMDLQEIYLGWWGNPDSGVTELYRPFYRAYRSIPQGDYRNVSNTVFPVTIRVSGENFYLINKESFPVKVSCKLNNDKVINLVDGKETTLPDNRFELNVPGQGLMVFRSPEKNVEITAVKQEADSNGLKYLKEQIAGFRDAVKVRRDAEITKHLTAIEYLMREENYTEARRYLYRKDIQSALASLGTCRVQGKLLPLEKKFQVTVQSLMRQPLNAAVNISKTTGCWNVNPETIRKIKQLKTGETAEMKFDLENYQGKDGWGGELEVSVSIDGGKPKKYRFLVGGVFAYRSDIVEIGKDWSFSQYNMKEYRVRKKDLPNYSYRLGYTWNKSGLFMAVDVEDRDFMPPQGVEAAFKRDSIQLFIDGNNVSEFNDIYYDGSVFETVLSLYEGKPKIDFSSIPDGGIPAGKSQARLAVKRENNRTLYEVFIPAAKLPQVRFENGGVIGACLMVNNLMKVGKDEKLVTSPKIFPWMRPGSWEDLIFWDRPKVEEKAMPVPAGFKTQYDASVGEQVIDGGKCIVMSGYGTGKRSGWVYTDARPVPRSGKVELKFTARSGGGNQELWILVRGTDWKEGARKTFRLNQEWQNYTFSVDASSFKPETKNFTVDFSMNPGRYEFAEIKVEAVQ